MSAARSARVSVSSNTNGASDESPAPIAPSPAAQPINPDPTQADLARRTRIDRGWSAYRGEFPEVFKTANGQTSDNVKPNRCAAIVDKGVAWLFGKEVSLHVAPSDLTSNGKGADDTADDDSSGKTGKSDLLEAQLCKIWGSTDDMLTLLTMAAMNGGVSGHVFLKIIWDSEKMQYPRLSVLDSHNVYVLSDPDDCNRAVCYVIEYSATLGLISNGQQRTVTKRQVIALVDPDGNARYGVGGEDDDDYWTITNWLRYDITSENASALSLANGQQAWSMQKQPMEWPYPFPPIVDAMNLPNPNEFWGLPDLPPALIDLNERIQFVESNIAKIIKSHAHPWVFATGCDPSAIRNEPGVVQGLPSENSKVFAVSATGDLGSSMQFADTLRADMDEQSRVPAVALGRQESMPKGNLSGIALQLLFQPLVEKTELKRRLYGQLVRRASAYCLALMGKISDWRDIEVSLDWPDMLPNDDLAMAQTAQTLQAIGYSQTTLIEMTGGDPDTETDNKADEQQAQVTAFSQGKGMPPTDPSALAASAQMQQQQQNTPPDASTGPSGSPGAGMGNGGSAPPVNHPAAIIQRAKMAATAKQ